jgi:hypothetical protein
VQRLLRKENALRGDPRPGRRRKDRTRRRVCALDGPLDQIAAPRSSPSRPTATRPRCSTPSDASSCRDTPCHVRHDLDQAILPVERALVEQSTLLVVDNVESILSRLMWKTPEALSEDARRELDAILGLCVRLERKGDTRIVFTSREALPAPFDAERNRRELYRLDREDAVKLVERGVE